MNVCCVIPEPDSEFPYHNLYHHDRLQGMLCAGDHLDGFGADGRNPVLDHIQAHAAGRSTGYVNYVCNDALRDIYPDLDLMDSGTHVSRQYFADTPCIRLPAVTKDILEQGLYGGFPVRRMPRCQ